MSKFINDLLCNVKAGIPVLRIDSPEENRAMLELQHGCRLLTRNKTLHLEPPALRILSKAFAKLGSKASGLLDGATLSVDGPRLHELIDLVDLPAKEVINQSIEKVGYKIVTWDVVRGFDDVKAEADDNESVRRACRESPSAAFQAVASEQRFSGHILFVFKDCHPFLGQSCDDPVTRRVLREVIETEGLTVRRQVGDKEVVERRTLILLQPSWRPHSDIAHYLIHVDFELPDDKAINQEIDYVQATTTTKADVVIPPDIRQQLVRTLRGLTRYEVTNIASLAAVAEGGFTEGMVKRVQRLKAKTFEREESLTWIDPDHIPAVESFAGIDNYLEWIREAREAYGDDAKTAGVRAEKGALLLGIPGTGKSMLGMATAKEMRLPLIKFDFSSVLGSYVGQSEDNMRRALRRIKAEGNCVLFVDEADKAFSNVLGPQAGSNVEQHIFGQFISWMANENEAAFILLTMNRTAGVPIEMLRSGRIGMIWYTTFPTEEERADILRLKLKDNRCDPTLYSEEQYAHLARETDQYVGAELEEIVLKATKIAWSKRKSIQPTFGELQVAAMRIRPVASLDEDNIRTINKFCQNKAHPVARPTERVRTGRKQRSIDLGGNAGDN